MLDRHVDVDPTNGRVVGATTGGEVTRARAFATLALAVALPLGGCSESGASDRTNAGGHGGGVANQGGSNASGGTATGGAATASTAGSASTGAAGPMQLISRDVPAFASSGMAKNANDAQPNIAWSSDALPAWLAYDVSRVPAAQRQQVLLAWYCYWADYLVTAPKPEQMLALDYVVETNTAPSAAEPPADGWQEVASVSANAKSARQHVFELGGASWVRLRVTESSDPAKVMIDMDLYSAPSGGSDGWLFMGDSITYMTTQRAFSNLPALVEKAEKGRVPLVIDGALGGTNTTTAQDVIATSLAEFEGRYVVLAYGTNDHVAEFKLEQLVQTVLAAGKIPVVPHVPWSDQKLEEGPMLNQSIDALYAKYPELVPGPDLWKAFENRTDLIPAGDIHPNADGQEFLRGEWAKLIASKEP
ncbi:MAG TPA: SGNH/GDSL hydrolase family protein [Polyangiaceae bacterium]|nr:SGNH/GDSL hydrolase family protein [Polyangiaceae bacterium]